LNDGCGIRSQDAVLMRRMLLFSSRRATVVASFVALVSASLVAVPEAQAQQKRPATKPDAKKDEKKEEQKKDEKKATQTSTEDEEKKRQQEAAKKAEEDEEKKKKEEFDDSKEADRAIYFSGDLAFTRPDMGGLSDNTGFDRTAANGFLYGLSAGLRLKDIRFGVRWRVYDTTEFTLWTFAASAGYALPLRPLSPIFSAHIGYVFDQKLEEALFKSSLPQGSLLAPDTDINGLLVGVDINASYWITKFLRLGAFVGSDLLILSRSQATPPRSVLGNAPPEITRKPLYTETGSGLGITMNIGFRGAFDIGF
jgi:hypothetical protein